MRKKNNWVLARIGNALITAVLAILVMATLTGFMIHDAGFLLIANMPPVISLSGFSCYIPK